MSSPVQPTWVPPDVSATRIDHFRRKIADKYSVHLEDYWQLWKWSVENVGPFWEEVWKECGIVGEMGAQGAAVTSTEPLYPPPQWFPGSSVNFAENMLRNCHNPTLAKKDALVTCYEPSFPASSPNDLRSLDFHRSSLTHPELYAEVARSAAAFRSLGIKKGDVLSAYSSNNGPSLIALLAASAIGAVWCSISSDSSPEAVLDRFSTVRPRWIVSVEDVRYNGKKWGHVDKLKEVLRRLEAERKEGEKPVEGVIVARGPSGETSLDWQGDAASQYSQHGEKWMSWESFQALGDASAGEKIPFERMDFNAPLWILFSSGTTGKPKAIVHRAGGMLLQLAKEHLLHSGLDKKDVLFQYSTLSWMMSPWSLSSLIAGSTLILYDGSPLSPSPLNLFELARREKITGLGASAAYLEILMKKGVRPREEVWEAVSEKCALKQLLSTGSSLRAEVYGWVRERVGNVLVGSITGGTDICSLFAGNNVALPVYPGEIQCPMLGMHVAIASSSSTAGAMVIQPLPPLAAPSPANGSESESASQPDEEREGELVCLSPFPAQPIYFYGEAPVPSSSTSGDTSSGSGGRYRSSYYSQFGPSVWAHGDWCLWTPRGGLLMKGRSDAVLNPGGVRFGSGEIYEVVSALATSGEEPYGRIASSIALALNHPAPGGGEVVVLLLQLDTSPSAGEKKGTGEGEGEGENPESLLSRLTPLLSHALRTRRSPRHVPHFITLAHCAPPRTINGKLAEVPAKRVLNSAPGSGVEKRLNTSTLEGGAEGEWTREYAEIGERLRGELLRQDREKGK